jgi:hypothetical protein
VSFPLLEAASGAGAGKRSCACAKRGAGDFGEREGKSVSFRVSADGFDGDWNELVDAAAAGDIAESMSDERPFNRKSFLLS